MIPPPNRAAGIEYGRRLARFGRPQNVLFPAGLAIMAFRINHDDFLGVGICYLMIFSLYALAAGSNNLRDIAVDRVNRRRDNPLTVSRLPSWLLAVYFGCHLMIIVLILIGADQPLAWLLTILYIGLLLAYSLPPLSLQRRGYLATACLAICYGTLPVLLGGALAGAVSAPLGVIAGLLGLLSVPLLLAKDYQDETGDRRYGKLTPLVRYGQRQVLYAAGSSLLTYTVLTLWLVPPRWPVWWGLSLLAYAGLTARLHYNGGSWRSLLLSRLTLLAALLHAASILLSMSPGLQPK